MLPEVGATELLVIAAIALIVVGPKDLPVMLRKLGQFLGRMRAMANEFRASFDEMARQSELDELRREVEAMRAGRLHDPAALADVEADQVFADIHAGLTGRPKPSIEVLPEAEAPPKPKKPRAPRKKKPEAEA
jgi:sec-independent protein translocase protein TatB